MNNSRTVLIGTWYILKVITMRSQVPFIGFDQIIMRKCDLFGLALKYETVHKIYKLFQKNVLHFFLSSIKTIGDSINFDDKNISKSNFYRNKNLYKIDDAGVNKISFFTKEPYGNKKSLKYFI